MRNGVAIASAIFLSLLVVAHSFVPTPGTGRSQVLSRVQSGVSDFTVVEDSSSDGDKKEVAAPDDGDFDVWVPPPSRPKRKKQGVAGTSWMDRNQNFMNQVDESFEITRQEKPVPAERKEKREKRDDQPRDQGVDENSKTFRQDFRGTRVFVQNIATQTSWQDLKDHFRVAGEVVFASVSVDRETGEPKGQGIVQFETTEGAKKAIKCMRDHPLDGAQLYVRADAQENDALRTVSPGGNKGPTAPSKWRCADEDALESMNPDGYKAIRSLIKARDAARARKNYSASDEMREDLKFEHGVHLDDRLKMWWVSADGRSVPNAVSSIKGDGRWGNLEPWRHIPTTPENDLCVSADLVEGLLRQRDIARREKDFATSDKLLEQARTSPDGDLSLRIHDESRTWRVWTDEAPPRAMMQRDQGVDRRDYNAKPDRRDYNDNAKAKGDRRDYDDKSGYPERNVARKSIADECIAIVEAKAPHKVNEVRQMLKQFPDREANILQKLKQRYND